MIKLELVASGLNYLKLYNRKFLEDTELLRFLKDNIISKVSTENDHISFLFNAYTEPTAGEFLKKYYRDSLYSIHADSGGLQAITLGKKIDTNLKTQVYNIQSRYADIGMSFDEIPITTTVDKSPAASLIGRTFDYHGLDEYIYKSANNFIEQIRYYLDLNSNCKPMYVLHGNCYDTLMKWYDMSMKIIPEDLKPYIGGISFTDSAMGNGIIEDVIQAFAIKQISNDFDKFHLLGIGSVKRLIPYIFMGNKFGPIHLSYDSTTLTQGVGFGRFYSNFKKIRLSREYNDKYKILYEMITNNLHDITDIPIKSFYTIINSDSSYCYINNNKKDNIDLKKQFDYYRVIFSYFFISVMNFMRDVRLLANSSNEMVRIADKLRISKIYQHLDHIETSEDLSRFVSVNMRESRKISTNQDIISTIERFF